MAGTHLLPIHPASLASWDPEGPLVWTRSQQHLRLFRQSCRNEDADGADERPDWRGTSLYIKWPNEPAPHGFHLSELSAANQRDNAKTTSLHRGREGVGDSTPPQPPGMPQMWLSKHPETDRGECPPPILTPELRGQSKSTGAGFGMKRCGLGERWF